MKHIVLISLIRTAFLSSILSDFLAWHIKFEKRKALKKKISEELMPLAWHPRRWWNFCMSENEKKNRTDFYLAMLLMYTIREY